MSPTKRTCPVEVPIGGLDEPRLGPSTVRAVCLGAEAVQRGQRATRGDFEDGAGAVGPSIIRRPVEAPIGGLDEPSVGACAVRAPALGAEAVQRGESLRRQGNRRGCAQDENSAGSRPPVQVAQNINGSFHGCAPLSYSDFHFWLLAGLWHDQEGRVARKRAAGGYHLDFSAAGAGGYGGGDFGTRNDCEDSHSAVKADAGRAGQIGPQNLDGRSHLTVGRAWFHKRSQTYRQAEYGAAGRSPFVSRCPVEVPIGVLDEPSVGGSAVRAVCLGAEAV